MAIVYTRPCIPKEFIVELEQFFKDITLTSMIMDNQNRIQIEFYTPIGLGTFYYETEVTQWTAYQWDT